jgi:hypothetical protein
VIDVMDVARVTIMEEFAAAALNRCCCCPLASNRSAEPLLLPCQQR